MQAIVEIKDNKAAFIMELLNSFSFVKVKPLTNEKALLLSEIREAVQELNLIKQGKATARPAEDLIDEL